MPRIDVEHRGPLVNLASWISLVAMIVFLSAKVATKWKMVRKLQNDDTLLILAMLTAVGHCVAVAMQIRSGLGQPEKALESHQFILYEKSAYVSQFFYVFTIYTAKTAALQFLKQLARSNESERPNLKRIAVQGSTVFIFAWLVIALLCISFQCTVPDPWDQASGRCFNQFAFWTTNGIIDIIMQLLIALAPIYLLFNLQLSRAKKRLAMLSFTPNITTIPFAVLRLVYLSKVYHSNDTTIDAVDVALVTVLHTNYCIIASCVTFLKPLIDALSIGLMTNEIRVPERLTESSKDKSRINPFAILGGEKRFTKRSAHGWTRYPGSSDYTSTVTGGKDNDLELQNLERFGSRERMVINQTKTTEVCSDPKSPRQ
ncbi:hypothetical protein BDR22DRAFT_852051 [Usnea florida]